MLNQYEHLVLYSVFYADSKYLIWIIVRAVIPLLLSKFTVTRNKHPKRSKNYYNKWSTSDFFTDHRYWQSIYWIHYYCIPIFKLFHHGWLAKKTIWMRHAISTSTLLPNLRFLCFFSGLKNWQVISWLKQHFMIRLGY